MNRKPPTRTEAKLDEDQHKVEQASEAIQNGGRERIRRKITKRCTQLAIDCLADLEEETDA